MSRDRKEFDKETKKVALARSGGRCECMVNRDGEMIRCNAVLIPSRVEYDHLIPDALGGEPTLENCVAACILCHAEKTKQDVRQIAKAKRLENREANVQRKTDRPLEGRGFDPAPPQRKASKPTNKPPANGLPELARRFLNG